MSDKVDIAVKRLREAAEMSQALYDKPLLVTYSGGKDSDTVLRLAQIAKIPFEVQHSHTTADAPETVYHVRDKFRELELAGIKCEIDYHTQPDGTRTTMWNLIPRKLIPPTRLVRYCCAELMYRTAPMCRASLSIKIRMVPAEQLMRISTSCRISGRNLSM